MFEPAPQIDERTADDFYEEVRSCFAEELLMPSPNSAADALIHVFARYAEIVVDRLNRVPERNLYAFLNVLGVSAVPALPARVPLTFSAIDGAAFPVRVPARTSVAATAQGDDEPVVFETERALEVTPARLAGVLWFDPARDLEADLSAAANQVAADETLFAAQRRSDHALYLGHAKVFGMAQGTRLRLSFETDNMTGAMERSPGVEWAILADQKTVPIQPVMDTTQGLSKSGEVVFDGVPQWPLTSFRGVHSRWLVARTNMLSNTSIRSLRASADIRLRGLPVEAGFAGTQALDLSKDFLPLSARPAFGSTLYLKSGAFSHPGAHVTLNVQLTNPNGDPEKQALPEVFAGGHPRLAWETWNGDAWEQLAETDSTKGFRVDGAIGFVLPDRVAPLVLNGIAGYWIRVRLISGHYGEEERWEMNENTAGSPTRIPATLSPPMIRKATIDYELTLPPEPFDAAVSLNQQTYEDLTARVQCGSPVQPFRNPFEEPCVLLGFDDPRDEFFRNRMLKCYLDLREPDGRRASRTGEEHRGELRWSYAARDGWEPLPVDDETHGWTRSGAVSFVVPDDVQVRRDIGTSGLFWVRVSAAADAQSALARIRGVFPNTVIATHAFQIEKEVLGSSDATALQSFYASRNPILHELELQVREADKPSEAEHVMRALPRADLEMVEDPAGLVREVWVQWHETEDLELSQPGDRHYRVDRDTGEISFGDGRHGKVPPRGSNNVRLRRYHIGGGARGNLPAGAVTQLRSAVPYIQAVTNHVAATGGFDAEAVHQTVERGAKISRHRSRAVTSEDFEDLACLASADVVRARCVPMRDLVKDPDGRQFFLGTISLLVLSQAGAAGSDLFDRVREFLDARRNLCSELIVTSPEFVTVSVAVDFTPDTPESTSLVQAALRSALTRYLDPVRGGAAGDGWDFGRIPERQEIYGLCASTSGLKSIRSLRMHLSEERSGAAAAGYFVVRSGQHKITPVAASVAASVAAGAGGGRNL